MLALGAGCGSDGSDSGAADTSDHLRRRSPARRERAAGQAIVNGAKLALDDAGGEAGGVEIGRSTSMTPRGMSEARAGTRSSSARTPVGRPRTQRDRVHRRARIGRDPDLAADHEPGGDPAGLAGKHGGRPGEDRPGSAGPLYQPSGRRTFGRVIPDIEVQAAAGEEWAEELGIRRVYPTGDGGVLGEALLARRLSTSLCT